MTVASPGKKPRNGIGGAALEQAQLLDATHGWAAGEIQVPLSRDPFVFITSDGGAFLASEAGCRRRYSWRCDALLVR